jgi:hypothetical protein
MKDDEKLMPFINDLRERHVAQKQRTDQLEDRIMAMEEERKSQPTTYTEEDVAAVLNEFRLLSDTKAAILYRLHSRNGSEESE